jgi:transposase-like protein
VSERMKRCDSETAETRMSVGEMTRERESRYQCNECENERARERVS